MGHFSLNVARTICVAAAVHISEMLQDWTSTLFPQSASLLHLAPRLYPYDDTVASVKHVADFGRQLFSPYVRKLS